MEDTVSVHSPGYKPIIISGYTTVFQAVLGMFPFIESILSLCGFCDEVVVMDGESTDGTVEAIQELMKTHPQIRLLQNKYEADFPLMDGSQKQLARMACQGRVVFQADCDEVVHEKDYKPLRDLAMLITKETPVIWLPVLNLAGSEQRADVSGNPTKWRMSWNHRNWGHGVVAAARRALPNGLPYSAITDGCEWVSLPEGEPLEGAGFLRRTNGDPVSMSMEIKSASIQMPIIWHYSTYSFERKARLWQRFWRHQWETIRQGPAMENEQWSRLLPTDPTDQDFKEAARKAMLEAKTYDISWAKPPAIMRKWCSQWKE